MKVGVYVHSFPTTSETFIYRQIGALIDVGHAVTSLADVPATGTGSHETLKKHDLHRRVVYLRGGREGRASLAIWAAGVTLRRAFRSPTLLLRTLSKGRPSYSRARLLLWLGAVEILRSCRFDI